MSYDLSDDYAKSTAPNTTATIGIVGSILGAGLLAWWLLPKDGPKTAGGIHINPNDRAEICPVPPPCPPQNPYVPKADPSYRDGYSRGQHQGTLFNIQKQAAMHSPASQNSDLNATFQLMSVPPAGRDEIWNMGFWDGYMATATPATTTNAELIAMYRAAVAAAGR